MRTISLALLSILTACGACSDDKPGDGKTFVLVHGAFMGAAAWDPVAAELRDDGATVEIVKLPTNAGTMDAYVAQVAQVVDAASQPVTLVGHSMGGMVISQVAARYPAKVARLAYIAAYVPQNDQSLLDLALTDKDSQLGKHLQQHDNGTLDVAADAFPGLFCGDCPAAAVPALVADYHTEPGAPLQAKVTLGAAFAAIPKIYVRTTKDLVVSPALQTQMIAATPMQKVTDLPTSHVPMLVVPAKVAAALLD